MSWRKPALLARHIPGSLLVGLLSLFAGHVTMIIDASAPAAMPRLWSPAPRVFERGRRTGAKPGRFVRCGQ